MTETISQRFDVACRNYPDRAALFDNSGEAVSFERLYYSVHSLAQALLDRDVRTGSIISLYIADTGARLALTLAAMRIGVGVALFRPPLPAPGEKSGINHYVVDATDPAPDDPRILRLDPSWLRQIDKPVPQRRVGAIITSSSGTTGFAKVQVFSENVLLARADLSNRALGTPDAPILVGFNPSLSAGFQGSLIALILGQSHLLPHRNPHETLRKMAELGVGYARMPPFTLRQLIDGLHDYDGLVPRMKQILVGGASTPPELAAAAEKAFGCVVYNAYGSTESGLIAAFRITDAPGTSGLVGKIRPELPYRLVDENGADAIEGELHIRVPANLRGSAYLNAEGPHDAEGWLATGDVGSIDANGRLVLTGRRAEFINAGGTKRAPELIEQRFAEVPGVRDAAAFAIANGWGSDDAGLLLVADRALATEAEVRGALADAIQRGFVFRVFFGDEIPRTTAGKIDRKYLSDLHRDRVADLTLS